MSGKVGRAVLYIMLRLAWLGARSNATYRRGYRCRSIRGMSLVCTSYKRKVEINCIVNLSRFDTKIGRSGSTGLPHTREYSYRRAHSDHGVVGTAGTRDQREWKKRGNEKWFTWLGVSPSDRNNLRSYVDRAPDIPIHVEYPSGAQSTTSPGSISHP